MKTIDLAPPSWARYAACNGMSMHLFFPGDERPDGHMPSPSEARATANEAAKVCARCPVRPQCLDRALLNGEPEGGVWGGVWFTRLTRPIRRARLNTLLKAETR